MERIKTEPRSLQDMEGVTVTEVAVADETRVGRGADLGAVVVVPPRRRRYVTLLDAESVLSAIDPGHYLYGAALNGAEEAGLLEGAVWVMPRRVFYSIVEGTLTSPYAGLTALNTEAPNSLWSIPVIFDPHLERDDYLGKSAYVVFASIGTRDEERVLAFTRTLV